MIRADCAWFCEDVEAGDISWWRTEAEAIAAAEACIRDWQKEDLWEEAVQGIRVGKITQQVVVEPPLVGAFPLETAFTCRVIPIL